MGPKVVNNDFFQRCSFILLGGSNKWFKGHFEPSWTHMSPCKPPKSPEIGNFGTNNTTQEGPRGMQVEG